MSALTTICGLSVLDEWIDEVQEQALLAAVDASPMARRSRAAEAPWLSLRALVR